MYVYAKQASYIPRTAMNLSKSERPEISSSLQFFRSPAEFERRLYNYTDAAGKYLGILHASPSPQI
jgi:hypothetical protein